MGWQSRIGALRGAELALATLTLGGLLLVIYRTAWVADDAYFTLRTVDHVLSGFGPRYNINERVQTYTHPLWMGLLTLSSWLAGGDTYHATLALGMATSLAAACLLVFGVARRVGTGVLALLALIASNAFVDFTTGGLENPLSHLLFLWFTRLWTAEPKAEEAHKHLGWCTLVMALAGTNRLDSLLCYLPAWTSLSWRSRKQGLQHLTAATLLGLLPLLGWLGFSLIYYGFPFPNTAYAKLAAGIPRSELAGQGLYYLYDALRFDPVTVGIVAAGLIWPWVRRDWQVLPLWGGLAMYLLYTIWVGGDFMTGRFLTLPVVMALAILLRCARPRATKATALIAATSLGVCVAITPHRAFLTDCDFGRDRGNAAGRHGVIDERRYYFQVTGLCRNVPHPEIPTGRGILRRGQKARKAAANRLRAVRSMKRRTGAVHVEIWGASGMRGYFSGPFVHVVDRYALTDPLLARMPMEATDKWRIGHFVRRIPAGYEKSVLADRSGLRVRELAHYDDLLRTVTRGPISSLDRLQAIWTLNVRRPLFRRTSQ